MMNEVGEKKKLIEEIKKVASNTWQGLTQEKVAGKRKCLRAVD